MLPEGCQQVPHKGCHCEVFLSPFQCEVSVSDTMSCCLEIILFPAPAVDILFHFSLILSINPELHVTFKTLQLLCFVLKHNGENHLTNVTFPVFFHLLWSANITRSFRLAALKYPAILPIFQATPKDNQMPSSCWL